MSQQRPIKTGVVTGVHGEHIFIESEGVRYFTPRQELQFPDPYISLKVTFTPLHSQRGEPFANEVRRPDGS